MGGLLLIGSAVADVVVRVPRLPVTGDDLHVLEQHVNLGGCACNAFLTARRAGSVRCDLFAPVGGGLWGDWVRGALDARGVKTLAPPVHDANGCCYCLVEEDGERTFLCQHGAEYRFCSAWFDQVSMRDYDAVYLCGLEVEEPAGDALLDALEHDPPRCLYFAPGPRLCRIPPRRMARVMAMHPILHLGDSEAEAFTRQHTPAEAAALLHELTGSDVVITMGAQGAYVLSDEYAGVVPGCSARVVDTIGAGDSHIGALMAARAEGMSIRQAVRYANHVAAAVVGVSGVELKDEAWRELRRIKEEIGHEQH
ncbi:MAG: PfkB family carbohydrate kinase [bacterium]|nr:PfkB family carbohydrate kinase [bacterium]